MNDATARRHDVLRAAMTLDEQLDDIKRAQIWAELEDRLTPAPAPRRWPLALAATAVAAAAALALVWLRRSPPRARTLDAPADTTLATSLGPHARAELVGPASLELVGAPGDATSVRLHTGTLVAEFTGGPGRSLRIETREAVVEIVGTLFTVEAHEGATCVSVEHGKVRVTTKSASLAVAGGESWCSTTPAVTPIQPTAHDRLARFAAVITARAEEPPAAPGPPVAAAPPVVASPPVAPMVATSPVVAAPPTTQPSPAVVVVHAAHESPTVVVEQTAQSPTPVAATTVVHESPPVVEATPPTTAAEPPTTTAEPPSAAAPVVQAAPPAPTPVVQPPPPPTAESLYESAEAALARRDAAGADRILTRIVAEFPHASLVDQALFERARIAYGRHAWRDAQQDLDQLATIANTPLAEPGAYLACRIALEAHDGAAEHCLTEYRKAYPHSPHDLDVLGVLTDLAYRDGGCSRARPHIDELVRAYQKTTLTRGWLDRCPEGK